jgi:hypothetical protein
MSSNLTSDRVTITVGASTRAVHQDGTNMGFLTSSGGWDAYANNSGQIWAANYGWLHDAFFSAVSNCGGNLNAAGANPAINCYGTNCFSQAQCSTELVDSGGTVVIRSVRFAYANCNCNCDCMNA